MRNMISVSIVSLAAAGCVAVYQVPQSRPSAQFQLASMSDSTSTTARSIQTWMWKNEDCEQSEYGARGSPKFGNDAQAITDPVHILAGEKFVFTATYMDARFAQNRKCAVTGSFTPIAGRRYTAVLVIGDDVSSCQLGVYDVTSRKSEQIEFSAPRYLCEGGAGKSARLNGQPLWTNWKVQVKTDPRDPTKEFTFDPYPLQ
jgi:hypothetical protein